MTERLASGFHNRLFSNSIILGDWGWNDLYYEMNVQVMNIMHLIVINYTHLQCYLKKSQHSTKISPFIEGRQFTTRNLCTHKKKKTNAQVRLDDNLTEQFIPPHVPVVLYYHTPEVPENGSREECSDYFLIEWTLAGQETVNISSLCPESEWNLHAYTLVEVAALPTSLSREEFWQLGVSQILILPRQLNKHTTWAFNPGRIWSFAGPVRGRWELSRVGRTSKGKRRGK